MSCPQLLEQLNGNIHFQIFCDIAIDPMHPLTNYKLLDDIQTSFVKRGHSFSEEKKGKDFVRQELARVRSA